MSEEKWQSADCKSLPSGTMMRKSRYQTIRTALSNPLDERTRLFAPLGGCVEETYAISKRYSKTKALIPFLVLDNHPPACPSIEVFPLVSGVSGCAARFMIIAHLMASPGANCCTILEPRLLLMNSKFIDDLHSIVSDDSEGNLLAPRRWRMRVTRTPAKQSIYYYDWRQTSTLQSSNNY